MRSALEKKDFTIHIDSTTWPGSVPKEITALSTGKSLSMGQILLTTAVLTRPPAVRGFDLSDYWAFLL